MRLENYLEKMKLTQEQFAQTIGVKQNAVSQWISGDRSPRPNSMRRIYEVTKGKVTANDFIATQVETIHTLPFY